MARVVRLEHEAGNLDRARVYEALEPCRHALQIDPDMVDAYAYAARILARWADLQMRKGEDPGRDLESLRLFATQILSREPESSIGFRIRGDAYYIQARWQEEHGEEPRRALDRAISAYTAGSEVGSADAERHDVQGSALLARARLRMARGADPEGSFELPRSTPSTPDP